MAETSGESLPGTAAARSLLEKSLPSWEHLAHAFSDRDFGASVGPEEDTSLDASLEAQLSNYRAVVERANKVLGSAELATLWLSSPNPALSGEIPLQILGKENYSREAIEKYLEPIFRRIEFGIYV